MTPCFIVMQNHFIAKSYIYEDYVLNWLIPAMKLIEQIPEASKEVPYKNFSGYTYYPFLCERLISTYIHVNRYNLRFNFYDNIK